MLKNRIRGFMENEACSCSMDYGCVTPMYVYRMWGGKVSLEEIFEALRVEFVSRKGMSVKGVKRGVWTLTSSNANATRQTLNKFGLLSLLWQFCSYLFWPQWGRKR